MQRKILSCPTDGCFLISQVNTNGVLSLGQSFIQRSARLNDFNSVSSPPIIAPFWNDIDITYGGTIYYCQDSNPVAAEKVQQEISSLFPEAEFFHPSLVFVATWDRVASEDRVFSRGLFNTFQVTVASDGTWTFVKFSYGDIQFPEGFRGTLIGVSAGDRLNFVTHPASLTSLPERLDGNSITYRVDSKLP